MDYNTYCKKTGINNNTNQAATMYNYYLEARVASTDFVSTVAPTQVCREKCSASVPCQEKNGKTMYVDNDKHIESSKVNYLQERAANTFYRKEQTLPKTFGLENDTPPETPLELVKRIQDGKFVTRKETEDRKTYDPVRFIVWRDPSVKEDLAGLEAAQKDLKAALQDTRDTVAIGTPVEGLAAVKALDAWTPTVGNA